MKELKSILWRDALDKVRKCHLSLLDVEKSDYREWAIALDSLISAILDERKYNPVFAEEIYHLNEDTGVAYDFSDIFDEYFDYMEANEKWDLIIKSANDILNAFAFNNASPSIYKYRIGNALMESGRLEEAEKFGRLWLKEYPKDLYAAASNAYLLSTMGRFDEATAITEKYLSPDLVCDDETQTIFIAAMRLYELTDNQEAKKLVSEKIAKYNELLAREGK